MFSSHARALVAFGAVLCGALVFPTTVGAATRPNVAVPVADYQFQNTRTDSLGAGPALTDVGGAAHPNTFTTDTVDGASHTVLSFKVNHGLALTPTTGLINSDFYSIVILAKLSAVDGYRKLIDFKHARSDDGLYENGGLLYFYPEAAGTTNPIKSGHYFQVVLTRDPATKMVVGYVNGAQQFSFKDTTRDGIIDRKNLLRFFIDDKVTSGEDSSGAVARLRIYNAVLTPAEVAALDREPAG
jgi:hypothetical protein